MTKIDFYQFNKNSKVPPQKGKNKRRKNDKQN